MPTKKKSKTISQEDWPVNEISIRRSKQKSRKSWWQEPRECKLLLNIVDVGFYLSVFSWTTFSISEGHGRGWKLWTISPLPFYKYIRKQLPGSRKVKRTTKSSHSESSR